MQDVRYILFALILSCSPSYAWAQAPVFSQYYASGLYLNPALAGAEKDIYLGINYRSQWSKLNMPFNTFQFTLISPVMKHGRKHLGSLGLSVLNDQAGPNNELITRSATVTTAYNFHLSRYGNNIVSLAAQGGVVQQRVDDDQHWSSQYSPGLGYDPLLTGESGTFNNQVIYPVVNAGIMWHVSSKDRVTSKPASMFHGFSVSYINRPKSFFANTTSALSILYKVHGGLSMTINRKFDISPNYLIQYQNNNVQVNAGLYAGYSLADSFLYNSKRTKVILGVWYRLQDAFIVSTGFTNPVFNIGFSYDTNVASMQRTLGNASAYEISLAYKIVKVKSVRRFSSPLI